MFLYIKEASTVYGTKLTFRNTDFTREGGKCLKGEMNTFCLQSAER